MFQAKKQSGSGNNIDGHIFKKSSAIFLKEFIRRRLY